jgi:hypothetical protein
MREASLLLLSLVLGCGDSDPGERPDADAGENDSGTADTGEPDSGLTWGIPEPLPAHVNAPGGWTDMPAISNDGNELRFVHWAGHGDLGQPDCDVTTDERPNNHGRNFDLYTTTLADGEWSDPVPFEPFPSERFSTSRGYACLGQAFACGCTCGSTLDEASCDCVDCPCTDYDGCTVGDETAWARSHDGGSAYFARVQLEYNEARGCTEPIDRMWVTHFEGGAWADAVLLPTTINEPGIRVDTPGISPDNLRLCYSRVSQQTFDDGGDGVFELYCSDRTDATDDQGWGTAWPSELNRPEGFDFQPMFTANGDLLFTTTRGRGDNELSIHLATPSGDDYVDTGIFEPLAYFDAETTPEADRYHLEGAGSLSGDGNAFYFIRFTERSGSDICGQRLTIYSVRRE